MRYCDSLLWRAAALSTSLLMATSSFADPSVEVEPNNTCLTALEVPGTALPGTVLGQLSDSDGDIGVDFFLFRLVPWQYVRVDLIGQDSGNGTLSDPYLGLFDSACNLLGSNDDARSLDSSLTFKAPADGVIVLAAASCCDSNFTGNGGSRGTYVLTLSEPQPPIEGITGRVVDRIHGQALSGESPYWAYVNLTTPEQQWIASTQVDQNGRFTFYVDDQGQLIQPGTYLVYAEANGFKSAYSEPFEVAEGGYWDMGDIALVPPAVMFADLQVCDFIPPEGGQCTVSVRLVSNRYEDIPVEPWIIVQGGSGFSPNDYTIFEMRPQGAAIVTLPALGSRVVEFLFQIPGPRLRELWLDLQAFVARADTDRLRTFHSRSLVYVHNDGEKYAVELNQD